MLVRRLRLSRPAVASLLAALALLSACQVAPGSVPTGGASKKPARDEAPRTGASGPPASAAPSASPLAGTTPPPPDPGPTGIPTLAPGLTGPSGLVSAAPTIIEPEFLRKPPGASVLAGTVKLDANFLVAAGGGQILSHNGGVLVAAGGGNILSHNGGQILSHNGGVLVAAGAGNILSHNGGVMVAAGAGNLVAAGGGNLVAAGGGNIISQNGGTYRLAQAEADPSATPSATTSAGPSSTPSLAAPAIGTIAPAAGVEIGVWSIERQGFLPIGTDAAGQPVYTVYTNLEGKYELYMPADEQGSGIVVAVVDRAKSDPRLSYGVLTPIQTGREVAIDEDTVLVTSYVREALAARLRDSFTNTDTAGIVAELGGQAAKDNPAIAALLTPLIQAFGDAGRALQLDRPENGAKAQAAVRRATDYALRRLDLPAVARTVRPDWYNITVEESPFDVLLDVMRTLRAGATVKLAADPDFAAKTSFMSKINARRELDKLPPYAVRKPADFGQIAVEEYLTILDEDRLKALVGPKDTTFNDAAIYKSLRTVLRACGALSLPETLATRMRANGDDTRVTGSGRGNDQIDRLNVAVQSILMAAMTELFTMSEVEHAEMRARLAEPTL